MVAEPLRIVADEKIPCAAEAFAALGRVVRLDAGAIDPEAVAHADALIVRSVTRVDAHLLAGSRVRFVATATSGYDHIDRAWLAQQGIGFAHAPGCNATAVADWVIAALAALADKGHHTFADASVGVIGCGEVGGRVAARLAALGYRVHCHDPPRAAAEGCQGFVERASALACDVVTLHVPLTDTGPFATRHLIDAAAIQALPDGGILLNAARGGVVDEDALATRLDDGPDLAVAIDTWANEPAISTDLLTRVDIGTPHIAGHSHEGRLRATAAVARAAASHFGAALAWDPGRALAPAPTLTPSAEATATIRSAYDPVADDRRLRELLRRPASERPQAFERIRAACGGRREFGYHEPAAALPGPAAWAGFAEPEPLTGHR